MMIKAGASIKGAKPELVIGLIIAASVYETFGVDLVVTEITGGTHSPGSLHYVGLAADLRTNNVPEGRVPTLFNNLKIALGAQFDTVQESDHIHIEFQPKN